MNSSFAPKSHFFTDPAAFSQSEAQAFGPAGADEFRLTSSFTVSAAAPAFAICKGAVLIQPQTGSADKVNLILRPFSQPVQGVSIRYFIYRGLNKSDFFTGDNVKATVSGTTSAFIDKINADFTAFYTNHNETPPPFLAKYIGFDPAQSDSLPLDHFFFKQADVIESNGEFVEENEAIAFELPMIPFGATLGTFAAGDCGLDIVLSYGDYQLPAPNPEFVFNLAYARAADASISLTGITDAFQQKLKKEQVFQFLDAAAYFGFHHSEKGSVTIESSGAKVRKTGDDIYTSVIQPFYTKNRLYLYIQSDRTRSYNFYGNYTISESNTNSLLIGPTEETVEEAEYQTDGWPLLIIDAPQAHNESRNTLYLQLVTDNNVNTALYGQAATVANGTNNFMDADQLRLPPDSNGEESVLTGYITLSNPNTGVGGSKLNVAGFNILLYQGKTYAYKAGETEDELGDPVDILAVPNFFDDVFGEIDASPLLVSSESTSYSITSSQKLKLINQYYNRAQQGLSAVQTVCVNDVIDTGETSPATLSRVTYITEAVDVLTNAVSVTGSTTNATTSSPSVTGSVSGSKTYQLPQPYYYDLTLFTDSTETITGLTLKAMDGSVPNKIVLGITGEENDRLKELITEHTLTNARLFLVDLFEDGNELVSAENITYQKYKAGIVGETAEGGLELFLPEEEVMVYSVDRRVHFSEAYSQYIEQEPDSSLTLDLDISL